MSRDEDGEHLGIKWSIIPDKNDIYGQVKYDLCKLTEDWRTQFKAYASDGDDCLVDWFIERKFTTRDESLKWIYETIDKIRQYEYGIDSEKYNQASRDFGSLCSLKYDF